MSDTPTPSGAGTDAGVDPNPGVLWPVGARLVSATRSMLWLAPLLGGLMLLVHFWRVGYLPALSFSELGVVLGAFGLFVALALGVALLLVLLPAWSVRQWVKAGFMPSPPIMTLPMRSRRRFSLSRQAVSSSQVKCSLAWRRTFSKKFKPGALLMFWSASTTAIALSQSAFWFPVWKSDLSWGGMPIAVLFGGGALCVLVALAGVDVPISARILRRIRRPAMQFLLLLALYLVLWFSWVVLLFSLDALPEKKMDWVVVSLFAIFLVPFVHWIWYASMRAEGPGVTNVRVVMSVMLLSYTGLVMPALDGAASNYGFGMMRKVDLVLSARGCGIVQEALPGQACEPSPAKGDDDKRVYRLRGVDVLTRIGASYVIAPAGGIDDRTLPRLALPADEVHALVRSMEDKVASH